MSTRRPRRSRSPSPSGTRSLAWARLRREVAACRGCALHLGRTQTVFYRGGERPRIVFVGEAPGREEDRQGLPFVGRSGRRLDQAIAQLGLPNESFGILNLIKCRPPDNRFDRAAAVACRGYLDRQLALLAPERLVSLGAHALHSLAPSSPPMLQSAGRPTIAGAWPLFPMLHPAATLRSVRWARRWEDDLVALRRWLEAPAPPPRAAETL